MDPQKEFLSVADNFCGFGNYIDVLDNYHLKEMTRLYNINNTDNIFYISNDCIEVDTSKIKKKHEETRNIAGNLLPTSFTIPSSHSDRLKKYADNSINLPNDSFIKSIEIWNVDNEERKTFKIVDREDKFLFNSDDIPQFFYASMCEPIYFDIPVDDKSTYMFKYDISEDILFDTKFYGWFNNFLKLHQNRIKYVIGDRVLTIDGEDGRVRVYPKSEFPEGTVSTFLSFSSNTKSASKSANKK